MEEQINNTETASTEQSQPSASTEQVAETVTPETAESHVEDKHYESDAEQVWREMAESEAEAKPTESVKPVEAVKAEADEAPVVEDYKAKYEELAKKLGNEETEQKKALEEKVKKKGFDSVEEYEAHTAVQGFEFDRMVEEADKLPQNVKLMAFEALQRYADNPNAEDLKIVKSMIDPDVLEQIAIDKKQFKDQKYGELESNRMKQTFEATKAKVVDFANKNKEWLDNPARVEAVGMIVKAFGVDSDLDSVKGLVDKIEAEAIKRYEQGKNEQARKQTLTTPNGANLSVATSADKWFTRSELNKMSAEEYSRNSAKIIEQMELEKNGELPRKII